MPNKDCPSNSHPPGGQHAPNTGSEPLWSNHDGAVSDTLYRTVIETSADGFLLVDLEGRILGVNQAYVDISGYGREELLSMRITDLDATEPRTEIAAHLEKILRSGSSDIFDAVNRAKNGTVWAVEINASYSPIAGGHFFVHLRDSNRRKRSEALLAARFRLSDLAERASLDRLMQATLDEAERFTRSRIGFFHVVDDDQEQLTLQAWSTNTLKTLCSAQGKGRHYPIGDAGVWVNCFHTRQPVVVEEYSSLPNRKGMPDGHAPVSRMLAVPVIRGDNVKAILGVGNKTAAYSQDDIDAVAELASLALDLVERKQAEQALVEREQQLRALSANLADGMVYQINSGSDGRQRRISYLSPAVGKLHGLTVAEVIQDPALLYDQVVAEDRPAVARAEAQAFATRTKFEIEVRVRLPSGQIRWRRFTSYPRQCPDGSLTWDGIEVDITEHKLAEAGLKESEERFRLLLQGVPAVAVQGYAADGTTLYWNEASELLYGYAAHEAIGKNLLDLIIPPELQEEVRRAIAAMAESGQPIPASELTLLRKDGSRVAVFSSHAVVKRPGQPPELFCIDVDLTARKQAEEALARTNEDLSKQLRFNEALLESLPIPVFIKDAEGRYTGCNRAFCEVIGVSAEEMIGKTVQEIWPAEQARTYREHDLRLLAERGHQVYEHTVCTKRGETLDVIFSKDLFYDEKGRVRGIVGSFLDISSRKQAEEALAESEARFRSIFDHIGSGISLIGRDMEILSLNPQMQRWFPHINTAERHLCYQSFNVPPRDSVCEYCPTVLTLQDGQVHTAVTNTPSPDGVRHYRIIATPMFGRDGTIEAAIEMVDDITEQVRAEETLRKRERQLTESQRAAKIGSWSWDLVANTLDWSDETYRRFDKDPAAFTPTVDYFVERIHPDDRNAVRQAMRNALTNDAPYFIQPRITNESGRAWVLEGYGMIERDDTGKPIRWSGTAQDITERNKAEVERGQFLRFFQTAADLMCLADPNGAFVRTNPACTECLGYSEAELIAKPFIEFVHPDDRQATLDEMARQLRSGFSLNFENRYVCKDGSVRWLSWRASYDKADGVTYATARDITERKQAEDALRRNEEFIRGIHNSVDEGFIVVDRTYRILSANRAYCQQTGVDMGEVVGKSCFEVTHQNPRPCYEEGEGCAVKKVFESGVPGSAMHKHTDAAGNILYVETKAFPLKDATGEVTAAIEVIHNVTERYLLEAEQLKTQKLEAIGTLAGGIAHDFNNLLQGVFGYVSMAKLSADQPAKVREMLDQAEKALSLSVNLTTQLLTFAKGGKPTKTTADLRPVIENATKFALSGSPCDYRLVLPQDLWLAEVDEGQIAQVIQNIVLNASEAMPTTGTVMVTAANLELNPGDNPAFPEGGRFVQIAVKDNGIGIPDSYLTKIFDPYFTTKQKGSGLGLATSYSIVKNHGGGLDVVSTQNMGSTFIITLRASEVPPQAMPPLAPLVGGQPRQGRILVMDDEEMVLTLAREMIRALGHEAVGASHGEEAIAKYRQAMAAGQPFDLVILDLTIKGGMGGESTIRALREIDPHVKAVVSSGYSDGPVVSQYEAYGFVGRLNKPYSLKDLRESLEALLQ